MTRWLVTLAGDAADLDWLVEWPDGDAWKIVRDPKRGVVLCGERFEALGDHGGVRRAGEALIKHFNRIGRDGLTNFKGVALGLTVKQGQSGDDLALQVDDTVQVQEVENVTVTVHGRADAIITNAAAKSDTSPPLGVDFARLVTLLEANRDLAAAFDYIQDGDDWDNTYKAFEAIRDSVGSHAALLNADWCSKRALSRFTQSAQPNRHHGRPKVEEHMTEAEGRAFVRDLLDKLIKHLDS